MTWASASVEALVGGACIAMAWPCWRRGTALFRVIGVFLGLAGIVAIANAAISIG